jgi:hypothetical protein
VQSDPRIAESLEALRRDTAELPEGEDKRRLLEALAELEELQRRDVQYDAERKRATIKERLKLAWAIALVVGLVVVVVKYDRPDDLLPLAIFGAVAFVSLFFLREKNPAPPVTPEQEAEVYRAYGREPPKQ